MTISNPNWWHTEPFKYWASGSTARLRAGAYGINSDVVIIYAEGFDEEERRNEIIVSADWVHDHNVAIPFCGDGIVAVVCGINDHDTLYLYGIMDDGSVRVCRPVHCQDDGPIHVVPRRKKDEKTIVEIHNGKHDPWPRYAYQWTGSEWIQSVRVDEDDALPPKPEDWNKAQLIGLRERGEGWKVSKHEHPSPPTLTKPK